jgi:hypothetical protein
VNKFDKSALGATVATLALSTASLISQMSNPVGVRASGCSGYDDSVFPPCCHQDYNPEACCMGEANDYYFECMYGAPNCSGLTGQNWQDCQSAWANWSSYCSYWANMNGYQSCMRYAAQDCDGVPACS